MSEQIQIGRQVSAPGKMQASTILRMLGVEFNPGLAFWAKNAGQLHLLYHDAKLAYRKAIFKCHPDRGGSLQASVLLNRRWKFLKAQFKKRLGPL